MTAPGSHRGTNCDVSRLMGWPRAQSISDHRTGRRKTGRRIGPPACRAPGSRAACQGQGRCPGSEGSRVHEHGREGETMNRQDLRHQGEAILKTLFGSTAQAAGLGHLLTEAAYGAIWSRAHLSLADRLVVAIAALAVGPRLKVLRRHLGAGLEH